MIDVVDVSDRSGRVDCTKGKPSRLVIRFGTTMHNDAVWHMRTKAKKSVFTKNVVIHFQLFNDFYMPQLAREREKEKRK